MMATTRMRGGNAALAPAEATRICGAIKTIKQVQGFGFITSDTGEDHFFHRSQLEKTTLAWEDLREDMRVSFIPLPNPPKGMRATGVRVIES
jgi:cold shock CspA family protein